MIKLEKLSKAEEDQHVTLLEQFIETRLKTLQTGSKTYSKIATLPYTPNVLTFLLKNPKNRLLADGASLRADIVDFAKTCPSFDKVLANKPAKRTPATLPFKNEAILNR